MMLLAFEHHIIVTQPVIDQARRVRSILFSIFCIIGLQVVFASPITWYSHVVEMTLPLLEHCFALG